jgi:hypothetical protein
MTRPIVTPKVQAPKTKAPKPKTAPSRFVPGAFLSGSPAAVQQLCQDLATLSAKRFAARTSTPWVSVAASIVQELRAAGHDLSSFDAGDDWQEWQADWHHPLGSFTLRLSFREPASVEVAWKTETTTFEAHG